MPACAGEPGGARQDSTLPSSSLSSWKPLRSPLLPQAHCQSMPQTGGDDVRPGADRGRLPRCDRARCWTQFGSAAGVRCKHKMGSTGDSGPPKQGLIRHGGGPGVIHRLFITAPACFFGRLLRGWSCFVLAALAVCLQRISNKLPLSSFRLLCPPFSAARTL